MDAQAGVSTRNIVIVESGLGINKIYSLYNQENKLLYAESPSSSNHLQREISHVGDSEEFGE